MSRPSAAMPSFASTGRGTAFPPARSRFPCRRNCARFRAMADWRRSASRRRARRSRARSSQSPSSLIRDPCTDDRVHPDGRAARILPRRALRRFRRHGSRFPGHRRHAPARASLLAHGRARHAACAASPLVRSGRTGFSTGRSSFRATRPCRSTTWKEWRAPRGPRDRRHDDLRRQFHAFQRTLLLEFALAE